MSFAKDVHMKLLQIMVFQWFYTVFHNLTNPATMHRFWFIILWIVSRNIKIGLEHLVPFSSPVLSGDILSGNILSMDKPR